MTLLGTLAAVLLSAAPAPQVTQKVVGEMGNIYQMEGSFDVAAPSDVVWSVLTDYGSHPRFVSDLKSSVVKERQTGVTMVAQEAIGKVAMFSATVQMVLKMIETPGAQIIFSDTLGKDFELFEGKWTMSKGPNGLHVDYTLRCTPKNRAPKFIVGPIMEESTRRLMLAMRTEIEKRAVVTVAQR
jgi:ribosome-associated toxin RatA of RatAB toxin-antitoxin module